MAEKPDEKAIGGDKLPQEKQNEKQEKRNEVYTSIRFSEFRGELYMFVHINGRTYYIKLNRSKKI